MLFGYKTIIQFFFILKKYLEVDLTLFCAPTFYNEWLENHDLPPRGAEGYVERARLNDQVFNP